MMPIINIIMDRVLSVNPADGQIADVPHQSNGQRLYKKFVGWEEKAAVDGPSSRV